MFGLGSTELILILAIILIIFGAGKLPEIGGAMGKAIKSFKKSVTEADIDVTPKEGEGEEESKKESIEAGSAPKDEAAETKTETNEEAEKPKDPVS